MIDSETLQKMSQAELAALIEDMDKGGDTKELFAAAGACRDKYYGKSVYCRGLIEFTNHCHNNCYYCGLRRDNKKVERYRLTKDEIIACCDKGHALGFRTFVLQGGEDPYYIDRILADIVHSIKESYPDCALTLSVGERSPDSYKLLKEAGADRYLLRHESANDEHYQKLHPPQMSLANRKNCLYELKKLGYQVGAGFMVGSPYQTYDDLAADLIFLKELQPEMVGIGPFIPQKDTPFAQQEAGSIGLTMILLAMVRLLLPTALIPATTAVGTLDLLGREKALAVGANVVMPNLSPLAVREKYLLYDNKISTGEETAEGCFCLGKKIKDAGFIMDYVRGDHIEWRNQNVY